MPLTMVSPGESVTLAQIRGGRRMRGRLADLGLAPGVDIRVVQSGGEGPIILALKDDARLAIGRGMAHHIQVCQTQAHDKE